MRTLSLKEQFCQIFIIIFFINYFLLKVLERNQLVACQVMTFLSTLIGKIKLFLRFFYLFKSLHTNYLCHMLGFLSLSRDFKHGNLKRHFFTEIFPFLNFLSQQRKISSFNLSLEIYYL